MIECVLDGFTTGFTASSICIDDACVCMGARASQRAVYRWWVAHAHCISYFLVIMSCTLLGVGR
jgi:hypothetical protein